MRIVREPRVYVVGRQVVDEEALSNFLARHHATSWHSDATTYGEQLVEVGGRVCYMSFKSPRPGGNEAYVQNILNHGHGSVLEHAVWTLIIDDVSRSLSHELVRHRVGISPSQLSQRYVDESDCAFVVPDAIAEDAELYAEWLSHIVAVQKRYQVLVDNLSLKMQDSTLSTTERRKAARQAARSVLPNATVTTLQITANARALRHFIELRGSAMAEPEIRKLAIVLLGVMKREAPVLFDDTEVVDGVVTCKYHKV